MWTRIFKSKPKLSDSGYCNEQQREPDQLQFTTPLCSYLEEFELENEEQQRKNRRYSLDSPTIFSITNQNSPSENLNAENTSIELKACPICNRKFNTTTYDKHVGICSTTASRKRKTFDSSRQRREGTDLASYLPKHFGLPASKIIDKPTSPARPAQIVHPLRKEDLESKIPQRHITSPKQSNATTNLARGRSFRASKRIQPPAPEQCPYCERFFGTKAYDRHVEWCKEKALQKAIKNTGATNAAKERLQARTQYKAPCLRSKRTVTREKYSPSGNAEEDERMSQKSISLSLTSSFVSDGGFSDKYDPFTSAKRQLEELCSPTLSTKSFFVETPSPQPPIKVVSNPTKSSFRRALSLRSPRKASLLPSRPVFLPSYNYRSTVQRGLSDEGPISTNFLKPEEYDEMPVRSVCQNDFAITNPSRLIRRDSSASSKRNMRLDLQKEKVSSTAGTVVIPDPIDITKTDSLAIFLNYEKDSKDTTFDTPLLSAKDLKDKSNTISKQNSSKELSTTEKPSTPKKEVHNLHSVRLEPIDFVNERTTNLALNSGFGRKEFTNEFIDPKLINICDNLSVNVTKLSDSDITSESSTHSVKKDPIDTTNSNRSSTDGKNLRKRRILLDRNQFLFDAMPDCELVSCYSSCVRSNDRKVTSPSPSTPQLDDFDIEEFLSTFRSEEKDLPLFKGCHDFLSKRFNNNNDNNNDNDNLTMSNNCPLISNPTILNLNNNAKGGNFSKRDEYGSEKGEIFISIETDHSENDLEHPAHDNPLADNQRTQVLDDDITDNKFSRIEDENDKVRRNNERNLKKADSYQSVEEAEAENGKNIVEKRSVDSAYGSLSRQNNNNIMRRNASLITSRTRPTTAANPETILLHSKVREESSIMNPYQSSKRLSRDSSSGGSETSLPPINLSRQELESNISRRTTPSPSTGKLSKFCHECGSKFIVECAKFCMECGVKRIVL